MRYLTNNEIAVHNYEDASLIASTLLDNDYVVMISREENLYIVNYVWSPNGADRNDVCFASREVIEDIIFNPKEEE